MSSRWNDFLWAASGFAALAAAAGLSAYMMTNEEPGNVHVAASDASIRPKICDEISAAMQDWEAPEKQKQTEAARMLEDQQLQGTHSQDHQCKQSQALLQLSPVPPATPESAAKATKQLDLTRMFEPQDASTPFVQLHPAPGHCCDDTALPQASVKTVAVEPSGAACHISTSAAATLNMAPPRQMHCLNMLQVEHQQACPQAEGITAAPEGAACPHSAAAEMLPCSRSNLQPGASTRSGSFTGMAPVAAGSNKQLKCQQPALQLQRQQDQPKVQQTPQHDVQKRGDQQQHGQQTWQQEIAEVLRERRMNHDGSILSPTHRNSKPDSIINSSTPVLHRVRSGAPFTAGAATSTSSSCSTPMLQRVSSGSKQRSFNTARHTPSLDASVASLAVARSLEMQYRYATSVSSDGLGSRQGSSGGSSTGFDHTGTNGPLQTANQHAEDQAQLQQQDTPSLACSCAGLCVQHCAKLQEAGGGETTVLDIGCGTGGCCFELAMSFSHVLGIDADPLNVVAAKEMKAKGELYYRPVAGETPGPAGAVCRDRGSQGGAAGGEMLQQQTTRVARVPDAVDRDKVRFWLYPLPELPPKLQPVDAVLLEDVEGRLGKGLQHVCQQMPALLNPGGVCVAVVGVSSCAADGCMAAAAVGDSSVSLDMVKSGLQEAGLHFVKEVQLQYLAPADGSSLCLHTAHAGVWLQPD